MKLAAWPAWAGIAFLAIGMTACSSEGAPSEGEADPTATAGGETGEAAADGVDDGTDGATDTPAIDPATFDPVTGSPTCGFDEDKQGKLIGKHIKNFGLKTSEKEPYWLHKSCGTEKKVVWLILGTGW